jgi:hypothetical protein
VNHETTFSFPEGAHAIPFESVPQLQGQVIDGHPFIISRQDRADFERLTGLTTAYTSPDPPGFPADVVEGFHILSLLDAMLTMVRPVDPKTAFGLNYGLNYVRWISPAFIGEELRPRFECLEVTSKDDGWRVTYRCTVTVDDRPRPIMIAEWVLYISPVPESGDRGGSRTENH